METNPSARTSRTYWCPRPVARRLPLFGRQPCICEHLSGEIGGAGRLRSVSSALQVRRAAIGTTAPKWTRRRDLHPRSSALQAGPLAVDSRSTRSGLRPAPAVRRSACWPPGHVVIENKTAAHPPSLFELWRARNYAIQPSCTTCAGCHGVNVTAGYLSQRRDSNPRISVLQTDALNHLATLTKNKKPRTNCPGLAVISINFLYHNIFPRHVHTSCFWQPCE